MVMGCLRVCSAAWSRVYPGESLIPRGPEFKLSQTFRLGFESAMKLHTARLCDRYPPIV
jgi:hypothetical protein